MNRSVPTRRYGKIVIIANQLNIPTGGVQNCGIPGPTVAFGSVTRTGWVGAADERGAVRAGRIEHTATFRAAVESARERQTRRFAGTGIPFNAAIPGGQVQEMCAFSAEATHLSKASRYVIGGILRDAFK